MDESVFIWVESVLHLRTYFPDWNLKLDLINIAHVEFNIGMHCSFIKLPYSLHPVGIEHLHYWVNCLSWMVRYYLKNGVLVPIVLG